MEKQFNVKELYMLSYDYDFYGITTTKGYICKRRYDEFIDIFTNEKKDNTSAKNIENLSHYYPVLAFKNNELFQTKKELFDKLDNLNKIQLLEDINSTDHKNILNELGLYEESKLYAESHINELLNVFKEKFISMTEEEREQYLKSFGISFYEEKPQTLKKKL